VEGLGRHTKNNLLQCLSLIHKRAKSQQIVVVATIKLPCSSLAYHVSCYKHCACSWCKKSLLHHNWYGTVDYLKVLIIIFNDFNFHTASIGEEGGLLKTGNAYDVVWHRVVRKWSSTCMQIVVLPIIWLVTGKSCIILLITNKQTNKQTNKLWSLLCEPPHNKFNEHESCSKWLTTCEGAKKVG
jgi:hypothetical protein